MKEVIPRLQAIHAMEDAQKAKKALEIVQWLKDNLKATAKVLTEGIDESLIYHQFPGEHHKSFRTNNMLERVMKKISRRTRVVGSFPDGKSALMLVVSARLRHIATKKWPEGKVLPRYQKTQRTRPRTKKRGVRGLIHQGLRYARSLMNQNAIDENQHN